MSTEKDVIGNREEIEYAHFRSLLEQFRPSKTDIQLKNVERMNASKYAQSRHWNWAEMLLKAKSYLFLDPKTTLEVLGATEVPAYFQGVKELFKGHSFYNLGDMENAIIHFQAALNSDNIESPRKAQLCLAVAHLRCGELDVAIEQLQGLLGNTDNVLNGEALNNIGIAYLKKGLYEDAVQSFKSALATPGYEYPGAALSNMGIAYSELGDYEKAIECFESALGDKSYDAPSEAMNNMGIAYKRLGENDKALEWFQKVLQHPSSSNISAALNNIGTIYINLNKYDLAIDSFERALVSSAYEDRARTLNNLALAHLSKDHFLEAEQFANQALQSGFPVEESRATFILGLLNAKRRKIDATDADIALASPEPKEWNARRMYFLTQKTATKYDEYLKQYGKGNSSTSQDELVVLRGWSSSVTLLEGVQNRQWVGGGIFVRWKGQGLVVDPGFDFIDNFHDAGFHICEVHAVAVSHDHPDHNGDLRSLDDLCYEVYRRDLFHELRSGPAKFLFMVDEDSKERMSRDTPEHRGSLCVFTEREIEDKVWFGGLRNNLKIQIEHFAVKHFTDVPGARGFRINLLSDDLKKTEFSIGYTGDTQYFEELSDKLKGVDILIAHVSQPDPVEFGDERHQKRFHLGLNGVSLLSKEVNAKLVLIGEFWAGLADIRLEITGAVRHRSQKREVLPAGLGLRVKLPEMTVTCTKCRSQVLYSDVIVVPATVEFGLLGYVCKNCMLS